MKGQRLKTPTLILRYANGYTNLPIIPMRVADNAPGINVKEAWLSLFSKGNYNEKKRLLVVAGFLVTERRYIGYEEETGYHHYSVDVVKPYPIEGA